MLITGQPPFNGRTEQEIWTKIRNSEPHRPGALNFRVDPDLEAICQKALDKNPAARPIGQLRRRFRWLRNHPVGPAITNAGVVVFFSLLAVIAIQSIALHDQKEKTAAARQEADAYRQTLEIAEEKAESLHAATAEDERRSTNMP